MNYLKFTKDDMLNGRGVRLTLWVAGCNHECPKCQNPETWDPNAGKLFTTLEGDDILRELSKDYISGLTLTGGDPLFPANRITLTHICKVCKEKHPDKNIWCWTGYNYEQVKDLPIMEYIDVLIDGRFRPDLYDPKLKWRGSSNQRVIDVQESRKLGKVVLDVDNGSYE